MSVRWQILVVMTLTACVAGCGGEASKARFTENTPLARPLLFKARRTVQKTVDDNFGTPLESVAWLKLPVNYGKAEGTIKSVHGQTLTVEFNAEASDVPNVKSPELHGTQMLFTSGVNAGKAILLASYPTADSFEALNLLESPPAAGDQFIVAGHVLKQGRKLYARHCQHCHGVSGDGEGPTAQYLNPKPRDYRRGTFKFTSTAGPAGKATRDDLRRVIGQGIPGTYMPAFVPMLKDDELVAIVEYVRWLAMRGEIERRLLVELKGDYSKERVRDEVKSSGSKESAVEKQILEELDKYLADDFPGALGEIVDGVVERWSGAEEPDAVILPVDRIKVPPVSVARVRDTEESRERGKKLFLGDKAKCVNCHGPAGRGNGFQTEDYQKNAETNEFYPARGLFDDWGNPLRPRDLTRGIYRGGRRPIDIYRRISEGIKGTPMPGNSKALSPEEIWDLVNYVLSIPFESSAPKVKSQSVAGNPGDHGHAN